MERLRAGSSWTDHDLVLATRRGGPIERTKDWRTWEAMLRQAQVRDARVHDARHTAATLLIEQGEFCSDAEHGETGVAGDGKTITCVASGSYWRWED